jgi:hypothetical protein
MVLGLPALLVLACGNPGIGNLTGDPLDPELHRTPIVAIDAVLFEDEPLAEDARAQVNDALLALAESAELDETNTIAMKLGQELRTLASMARWTRVGTPLAGSRLRQQWLRIRSSLFSDAAWFRRSPADPIEPAVAGPPPPSGLRPATAQERTGLDLALVSIGYMVDDAKQDFPNGSENARQELERNLERLGAPPLVYGIDNFYRSAHAAAMESIRNLRTLTGLGIGAPPSSREYLIRKAEEHLGRARAAAEKMMPPP